MARMDFFGGSPLRLAHRYARWCLEAAEATAWTWPLISDAEAQFVLAEAAGHGDEDIAPFTTPSNRAGGASMRL